MSPQFGHPRGRGRPRGSTVVRQTQREIGEELAGILRETPDADLRARVDRFATWLMIPPGERATDADVGLPE